LGIFGQKRPSRNITRPEAKLIINVIRVLEAKALP
jgi:hypothetical protein